MRNFVRTGRTVKIAFVGCGFVADFYAQTLKNHPQLELVGVYDTDVNRMSRFAGIYNVSKKATLSELLAIPELQVVVNLTNPKSHYEVSMAALLAGKHVYSEKPLAIDLDDARRLAYEADNRGLVLGSAPCSVLGECAQTLLLCLQKVDLGQIQLVYAELDDGPVYREFCERWISQSGVPWPRNDEFEVGCTIEHAAYYISWLVTLFGPVEHVTAVASQRVKDKKTLPPLTSEAPDFSVACLRFRSGILARLTNGIVADHNQALQIVGEKGNLYVTEPWNYGAPIYYRPKPHWSEISDWFPGQIETRENGEVVWERLSPELRQLIEQRLAAEKQIKRIDALNPEIFKHTYDMSSHNMDFCRGVAEVANAINDGTPCRLGTDFSLHVLEAVLAIQHAGEDGSSVYIQSSCERPSPMPWVS
jgi:predicted dehydrogenase